MKNTAITYLSSLPPSKGISAYTRELVLEMSKLVHINFLGFNKMYPKILYPSDIKDETAKELKQTASLQIKNCLNWYNPIGWVVEAFRIRTKIIHAQWWSYVLFPVYLTILGINKLLGRYVILTVHNIQSHEKNTLTALLNRFIYFLADEFIVHTLGSKHQLKKIIGNKKITVIPHGILPDDNTGLTSSLSKQKFQIKSNDKIVLFFGNIRDYKGLDIAIKALSLITDPSIKLLITGQCWEDWGKYERLIKEYDVHNRIIKRLTFIPENSIASIFAVSDIVILPYKYFDAQSGIGAKTIFHEKPLIVSSVGNLADLVDNQNEFIFEKNDHNELAKKIERIFKNPALIQKSKNIFKKKKIEYDWTNIAKRTLNEVYQCM